MTMGSALPMPDTMIAWKCIGCGRLDGPQSCIGVCEDRQVELVGAWDYAAARSALDDASERVAALEAFLRKLAHLTPRNEAWKATLLALQAEARGLLADSA
jgi:hypothetical protein